MEEYFDEDVQQDIYAILSGLEVRTATDLGVQELGVLNTEGGEEEYLHHPFGRHNYDLVLNSFVTGLTNTYVGGFEITPSDTAYLPRPVKAIAVGTAGDLQVTTALGEVVTIPVEAGLLRMVVVKVWDANTDADDLIGLY